MESKLLKQKEISLTGVLGKYFATAAVFTLMIGIGGGALVFYLIESGFLLPANAAERSVREVEKILVAGDRFLPESIPFYYKWVYFSKDAEKIESSSASLRQQEYAQKALLGGYVHYSYLHSNYYYPVRLKDESICVLQYDFSVKYANKFFYDHLPDFQFSYAGLLILLWAGGVFYLTKHYARILKKDADILTKAIYSLTDPERECVEIEKTRVRELTQAIEAMSNLRRHLTDSIIKQWEMEQQRNFEIMALTHDLKTPLTVIAGNAELLEELELNAEQREILKPIAKSTEQMQKYIDRILHLSKSQVNLREDRQGIDIQKICYEWTVWANRLCAKKQIRFQCKWGDLPFSFFGGDREKLFRAVLNLIENAIRYTPENGKIDLEVSFSENKITFSVTDTGQGFSEKALRNATENFYTDDESRSGSSHIGMGLSFAKKVAWLHHGDLILSNTDKGAKVEIRIRYVEAEN